MTLVDKLKSLNDIEPRLSLQKKILDKVLKDKMRLQYRRKLIMMGFALAIVNWIVMIIDTPPHGILLDTIHIHPLMELINNVSYLGVFYTLIIGLIILVGIAKLIQQLLIEKRSTGLNLILPVVLFVIFIETANISACSSAIVTQSIYQTKIQALNYSEFPKVLNTEGSMHFQ